MPELPEIETVKLQLGKALVGRTIEKIEVLNPKTFMGDKESAEGKKVMAVRRKAKVLLIDLEGEMCLAFHFKMSGQLVLDKDEDNETYKDRVVGGHPTEDFVGRLPSKHTRVIFRLDDGILYFNDQRMFGWVKLGTIAEIEQLKFLQELGPEPLDISADEFVERFARTKKPIKLAIMDQTIVSGVGNIYANDGLWEAKIDPRKKSNELSREQLVDLYAGVKLVLSEGIKYGGATAADAKYIDLRGLGGHYQEHFRTYDREGEKCLRNDGGIIERVNLGGRGTFYCPNCQI